MPTCSRCQRPLTAEKPVHLPDSRDYCAACCESMATDAFEMETGERFTQWIEKHPKLMMRYQPMEMSVRRLSFFFPLAGVVGGMVVTIVGCIAYIGAGFPALYLSLFLLGLGILAGLVVLAARVRSPAFRRNVGDDAAHVPPEGGTTNERGGLPFFVLKISLAALCMAAPVASLLGILRFGRPAGFIVLGVCSILLFGWLATRGLMAYMRAQNFELSLEDGVFHLTHGERAETFGIEDVERACVVRPGTIGATEGALGLKNGRMLTLDTCLSDLHALGVVMDLHFNREFPPSPDDIARVRRDKLRKIRGLS